MYRRKLVVVATAAATLIVIAALLALWSVRATERNLLQAELAHSLLAEHLQLSMHAYRLFKQLTDEIVLGAEANQSVVRNKRAAISRSLARIRMLELEQRDALGPHAPPGAVEDTDALEALIEAIVADFEALLMFPEGKSRGGRMAVILEDRIDVSFREAVNAALERQQRVVDDMQARVERVHAQLVGLSAALAILAVLGALGAGMVLVRSLHRPLEALQAGARALGAGELGHRVPRGFDAEFDQIAEAFNSMAGQLSRQHDSLDAARRELEDAVTTRTAELTSANAALQRADDARRQFFADVSHELRTPLTIIRGEAQVALRARERPAEDYREALYSVLDQAVGLSRLVDDMLFIARADAQGVRLQRQRVDLAALSADVLRSVREPARARGVELPEVAIDPPGVLIADPDRLRQMLLTLVDNALRYSPPGAAISVRWEHVQSEWTLRVHDAGPGIDPQDLPHIFDRFFRGAVPATHTQGGGAGLGLGLAVARAIVRAHNGEIRAESAPGQGTTMIVTLPDTPTQQA